MALENYHLVWLDPSPTNYRSSLSLFHQLLHSISHCSNLDEFHQFISSLTDVKIIVILADSFDDSILSQLDSIYSVYLLANREITSTTKKLQGTFTDIEAVFQFVRRDLRQIQHDNQSFQICRLNPIDPIYSSTMLLRDLLLQKPSNDQSRDKFLEFVRREYLNDSVQSALINEYSQCPDFRAVALHWFTREGFLSALVHRALRNKDAHLLDQLAFFIGDLHRQIEDLHRKTAPDEHLVVYYGRGIDTETLEKLRSQPDSVLMFETFLIATVDRDLSEYHAQQSAERAQTIPVLFQLTIDRTTSSFPFVRLNTLDFYRDTDEYLLLSLNPTFRLDTIQLLGNQIYQVNLSLIDPVDRPDSKALRFLPFVKTMIERGNLSEAKQFCHIELQQTPHDNHQRLAELHQLLGRIYQRMDRFPDAFDQYERSVNIRLSSFPPNDRSIAPECFAAASMLMKVKRPHDAIKYFQNAVEFGRKSSVREDNMIATFYLDLGKAFLQLGETSQAKTALQSALRYAEKSARISSDSQLISKIQRYIASIL